LAIGGKEIVRELFLLACSSADELALYALLLGVGTQSDVTEAIPEIAS
jgi:hypothetical protein